jgi:hypothetical protein
VTHNAALKRLVEHIAQQLKERGFCVVFAARAILLLGQQRSRSGYFESLNLVSTRLRFDL